MNTINGITINWDEESDNDLFGNLFGGNLSAPSFQDNNKALESLKSNVSFDDISKEYALDSPFGKDSLFYPASDGFFIDYRIDKKYLAENIIDYTLNQSIMKYNYVHYHLDKYSDFIIDDKKYDVNVEINSLSGEINFSKQPDFKFNFKLQNQKAEFKLLYEFVKFKNSADYNRIAIILTFNKYIDLKVFLDKLSKELVDQTKELIKKEFNKAFVLAKGQSEVLDFIYETAPDFVLKDRKDEDLYNDLILLSNQQIDTIRTNENISILNILDNFKDKKWFSNNINEDPTVVRNLLQEFSDNYKEKLIIAVSKIGNSIWTKEDKEKAWNYELYYSEFETDFTDKSNINDPYLVSTGFAYYNKGLKMYKIGTAIFAYEGRATLGPSYSREIGPDELQFAYIPMRFKIEKSTIYIPVFVAEYFTNKKIDEEWWTMLNNVVAGLLPESSASIKTASTIAKLFSGKKIQTVEELIAFLDKIDESVKATELEEYGIKALFRGTTRNAQGELYAGNLSSIAKGSSTSTDPIRAVIFGIESASKPERKGFLQIFVPRDLEGLNLQAPQRGRFDLELEVIIKTSPEELSKFAVIEMSIEDARKLVEEVYGVSLDTRMSRSTADLWLEETKKLTPKEALEFYKKVIKLKK